MITSSRLGTRCSSTKAIPKIPAILRDSLALPRQAATQDQVILNYNNSHDELDQVSADNTIDVERQVAEMHAEVSSEAEPRSLNSQQTILANAQDGSTAFHQVVRERLPGNGSPFRKTEVTLATSAAEVSEPTFLSCSVTDG